MQTRSSVNANLRFASTERAEFADSHVFEVPSPHFERREMAYIPVTQKRTDTAE